MLLRPHEHDTPIFGLLSAVEARLGWLQLNFGAWHARFMARCKQVPDVQTHVGHDVTYKCCKGAGASVSRATEHGTSGSPQPEWVPLKACMLTVASHTGLVLHVAPVPDESDRGVMDAYSALWKVVAVALSNAAVHALPHPTDQQATEESLPRLLFTDKARSDAAQGGTKFASTLDTSLAEAWPELPPESRAILVQRLNVVQDIWHAIQRMKAALPTRHPMYRQCLAAYRDILNMCRHLEHTDTEDLYATWVPKLKRQITAWEEAYKTTDVSNDARGKGRLFEWGQLSRALGSQPASVCLAAAGLPVEAPGEGTLRATINEARDDLMGLLATGRDTTQDTHAPAVTAAVAQQPHAQPPPGRLPGLAVSECASSDSEDGLGERDPMLSHGSSESDSSDSDTSTSSAVCSASRCVEPALRRTRARTRAASAAVTAPVPQDAVAPPPVDAAFQVNADEAEEEAVDAYLARASVQGPWLLGPTERSKVRQQVRNVTTDTTIRALVANATCDWDASCGTQKNERFHKELNMRLRAVAGRRTIPLLEMTACVVAWGWNMRHLPRVLARGCRVKGRSNQRHARTQMWRGEIDTAFNDASEGTDTDRPHSHLLQIQTRWQLPHPGVPHLTEQPNGSFASPLVTYCNGDAKCFQRRHARKYHWTREEVDIVRDALSDDLFMADVDRDNPFQTLAHERLANGPSEAHVRRLVYAIAREARLRQDRSQANRA